jgi:hypothetical protein
MIARLKNLANTGKYLILCVDPIWRPEGAGIRVYAAGNMKTKICAIIFIIGSVTLLLPDLALATQGHFGIEGVYAHQFAHIFFILSLGVLIYWLRARKLVQHTGWRFIQYSALFFILWNIDTITVHALDDQFGIIQVETIGVWKIRIADAFNNDILKLFYYVIKLDHLLCVPALLFLYFGLRRLIVESQPGMSGEGQA